MNIISKVFREIDISTLLVVAIDFASYFLIFLTMNLFRLLILDKLGKIDLPESIMQLTQEQIVQLSSKIITYYYYFLSIVVASILAIVILWSVSRALIWKLAIKEKITLRYSLKSLLMGFVWFGLGMIPLVLFSTTFKLVFGIYLILIYLVVFNYLTIIAYMDFSKTGKINILKALKLAWRADFIVSFVILAVGFIFLSAALYFINTILWLMVSLLYFAVARYFFIQLYHRNSPNGQFLVRQKSPLVSKRKKRG
jgi:hypothetical protein